MAYTSTLQKLAESLTTTFQNTIFTQSGDVGDSREKALIEYLRKVMPKKIGFDSGEVFDSRDVNSGQVDVIMYDNLFSTVFADGSGKVLAPIESTYGSISVKSKMNTGQLDDAIEGLKVYDGLKRTPPVANSVYIMPDLAVTAGSGMQIGGLGQTNINCIFAYDTSIAEQTILNRVAAAGCVDLLVIPNRLCVIGRHRADFGLSKGGVGMANSVIARQDAVPMFILMLQVYLSRNRLVARNVESLIVSLVTDGQSA